MSGLCSSLISACLLDGSRLHFDELAAWLISLSACHLGFKMITELLFPCFLSSSSPYLLP
jgi:hypothetical protein